MPLDTAVIFDLDGTLVDAFQDIANAVNAPLKKRGLATWTLEQITRMVGEGAGKLLDRASPHVPAEEFDEFRAEMMAHYREHPADHAFVYPGAREALEMLQERGVAMGILSNKPHPMTLETIRQVGLSEFFSHVQGQDDGVPRKPDAGALRRMMSEMNARQYFFVGDGVPDGAVARAAGIPFVAVLWGTRDREALSEFDPVAYVEHSEHLGAALARLID